MKIYTWNIYKNFTVLTENN